MSKRQVSIAKNGDSFSDDFYERLKIRGNESPDVSYTAKLLDSGLDKILKKIGEESTEFIVAAKNESTPDRIHELADLYYHLNIAMVALGITPSDVKIELAKRFAQSGIEEKASRN